MLLLFTFSLTLVFGDLVKLIWGSDFRLLSLPPVMQGSFSLMGLPFPRYNLFLLILGPLAAMGIKVSWVFATVFCIGCFLAGPGRRPGGPHPEHHLRHGPRHHHIELPKRHHWRSGQHLGHPARGP